MKIKTLTVKMPEELDFKLAAIAANRGESKSKLVRTAINPILSTNETVTHNSCLDTAKDLVDW